MLVQDQKPRTSVSSANMFPRSHIPNYKGISFQLKPTENARWDGHPHNRLSNLLVQSLSPSAAEQGLKLDGSQSLLGQQLTPHRW